MLCLFLVYDQIIGIVGFTNIHIFGITVALAWQLPHVPFFHEHFHSHTEEPLHNSKISVSGKDEIIGNTKYYYSRPLYNRSSDHYDTYYNRKNYHVHQITKPFYDYLHAKTKKYRPPVPINLNRYYFNPDKERFSSPQKKWDYQHKIYPALRMRRSIERNNENASFVHPEVQQYLHHHRNTRFDLYKSIEKYLNACV